MTKVTARLDDGRCSLRLEGHAEGSPAVCNMISGLVCTLAGWMVNHPEECRVLRCDISADRPGYALLDAEGGRDTEQAFAFVLLGLLQLERQHPELIRVEAENFFPGKIKKV